MKCVEFLINLPEKILDGIDKCLFKLCDLLDI